MMVWWLSAFTQPSLHDVMVAVNNSVNQDTSNYLCVCVFFKEICGNQKKYPEPNHDVFLTLTMSGYSDHFLDHFTKTYCLGSLFYPFLL